MAMVKPKTIAQLREEAKAEAANYHQDYDTMYINYLKISSIILEIIPVHKDYQTFLKDPMYSTYDEFKKSKVPAVLDEADQLTSLITQRDSKNSNNYSPPGSSSTENNNDSVSTTPSSPNNNSTELGISKSPVYIIGDQMIGR
ncbi:4365_t:CDS:2 [Ambispora gerdemannii]|uniref:4365_t:CDS:1 n=1 Tax=Ambispora gerdemannii TaxID=144530 RepID=A0A9N8YYZ1_9GLOM|nr:4365_t:CDS:2 [Ambispora gerdemannii]